MPLSDEMLVPEKYIPYLLQHKVFNTSLGAYQVPCIPYTFKSCKNHLRWLVWYI